jgi:hypothetical protein
MSWRSIRGRLERLARALPVVDPNAPPPHFWDVVTGAMKPNDLPADDRDRLKGWWDVRREESRRSRIEHVRRVVDIVRADCAPLGQEVPSAEDLVEREDREPRFNIIEELLRLVESLPPSSPLGERECDVFGH